MADYRAKVKTRLHSLVVEATLEGGADSMLSLICALEEETRGLRDYHQTMQVEPVFRCRDCGKHWTINITVKESRDVRPENCPTCYNRGTTKLLGKSCWTDTFRYVPSSHPAKVNDNG